MLTSFAYSIRMPEHSRQCGLWVRHYTTHTGIMSMLHQLQTAKEVHTEAVSEWAHIRELL